MKSMTGPPRRVLAWSAPVLLALIVLPYVVPPYQTVLLTYGLVFAIAALGFNLLLGYTGLLSFGHSAYFGMGAYAVAFTVKYLKLESMEAFLLSGILASGAVAALFGLLGVRYTKIFSGIFTGLAGALWVPLNGLTTPDILHWTFSGKMVFFTVLGGFQTFFGPIVGAIIFNYLETYAVGHTVYWQMVLGIVLVVLVLALPAGIVGTVRRLLPRPVRAV